MIVAAPGTMAEEVAVPETAVQRIPDEMGFAEAAGFHVAYGTSHMALSGRARLKPARRSSSWGPPEGSA